MRRPTYSLLALFVSCGLGVIVLMQWRESRKGLLLRGNGGNPVDLQPEPSADQPAVLENRRGRERLEEDIVRTIQGLGESIKSAASTAGSSTPRSFGLVANEDTIEVGQFDDEKKEGLWRTYLKDSGSLWIEKEYHSGRLQGVVRVWSETGVLEQEVSYLEGKMNGPMHVWYGTGQEAIQGYYAGGVKSGEWKEWYPSGLPKMQGAYLNDLLEGTAEWWSEDGKLDAEQSGFYVAGKRIRPL